jgi:excisionase family DNA binding protein
MSASFLTSFTEEEFKDFLKAAVREVIAEELKQVKPAQAETLSITEAASFLKLKLTTMYEKTSRKLIPHFKKGNKLYFNRTELEEWIKKGKVKTASDIESEAIMHVMHRKAA